MNLLIVRLTNITMSLERTRTEPNDKQIEGVDISVKVLSSIYPYITGWSFHKDYQKFSIVYIDLIINEDVFSRYHKIRPYFFEKDDGTKYIYSNQIKDALHKMNTTINVFYKQLPKELQMFNVWEYLTLQYRENDVDLVKLEIDELVIEKG